MPGFRMASVRLSRLTHRANFSSRDFLPDWNDFVRERSICRGYRLNKLGTGLNCGDLESEPVLYRPASANKFGVTGHKAFAIG